MDNWFLGSIRSTAKQDQQTSYESLLDIFTLLSFALIIVAFIYAPQQVPQGIDTVDIEAHIADQGSGTPPTLPKDLLLIIIYREQGIDKIMIIEGGRQSAEDMIVDGAINKILGRMLYVFQRAREINVVWHTTAEEPNPAILLDLQHWLGANGMKQYRVTFTGNYNG